MVLILWTSDRREPVTTIIMNTVKPVMRTNVQKRERERERERERKKKERESEGKEVEDDWGLLRVTALNPLF